MARLKSCRLRQVTLRLSLLAASSILALVSSELAVRVIAPQQLILVRRDIWQPDEDGLGWRHREHVATTVNTGEREVRFRTGPHGHRIAAQDRGSAVVGDRASMLVLGDSYTVGLQVEYEDLYVSILGRRLGLSEVENTAVSGWSPDQYLLEARRELAESPYDVVLVALFAGNDILERRRDFVDPKQEVDRPRKLRWPRDGSPRELKKALLEPPNTWLEERSHAFVLARQAGWKILMRLGLSKRYVAESILVSERGSSRWQVTADLVADIVDLARRSGAAPVVVLIPANHQVSPQLAHSYASAIGLDPARDIDVDQPSRLLGSALAERGVDLVDLLPGLRSYEDPKAAFGSVDTHLSLIGHERVAELLQVPLENALREAE